MAVSDLLGRRLALAALRLHEAGEHQAVAELLSGLSREELEAALISQTMNASLVLALVFGEVLWEKCLPQIAARGGRTRDEVIADYLSLRIALLAAEEWRR